MSEPRKIRVLVVDDSALARRVITNALEADPEIEVVGAATDPYVARDLILERQPDVLTLDIEMPRMDGLTFLKILQEHRPMPVVVVSSLTQAGSTLAMRALELGAVDVLAKQTALGENGQLAHRVKGAARAQLKVLKPSAPVVCASADVSYSPRQLVVIGASTGGTEAVKNILVRLPAKMPAICVVQHIPAVFSRAFAGRLNECCQLEVREAAHGDEARPGTVLIAPGDFHMAVEWNANAYRVRLRQDPPIHFTRPAVDVLFNSAAKCAGRHAVGLLLTGMGRDGAQGMQQLKSAGAVTLAQNEASCVVYGMPRAAVELGVVDRVLSLEQLPQALLQALQERATAGGVLQRD
jgi:two-component system, chemotaxis family, protein-glutamate methylesterase/glutaminase